MSEIVRFSVYTHCNELGGKVWNPAIRWTKKYAVFVVLEDSDGNSGLGECWCFDTSPDSLVAFLRTEVAPHILGVDPEHYSDVIESLLSRCTLSARHGMLASAVSGVDIAIWDLRSRKADLPLWKFLQTKGMHSDAPDGCVYLYGSGGLYGEEKSNADLVAEMQSIQAKGFDSVKMKIGALEIEEDLDRVNAVLSGLEDNTKLIVDGVYSYTSEQANFVYEALPPERIVAFQSPVAALDLEGMQKLLRAGVPVMATEAEYRFEMHEQLVSGKAVKYLQTAPVAVGGISRLIQLSQLIEETPVFLSLEVSSTSVALMAACHFASASDSIANTEFHFVHQVFFDQLDLRPIRGNPGWFQLPQSSGLGIELPYEQLDTCFEM